ncbi:TPA: hypothetical protein N0F65_006458 [Lagenidium giganteum]|uniref:Importin N-terminal domain-containing protein n=1 Tax=Lagenidium giganteum TaxID=4803 RepID=A0AAV2Z5A7_9STRA|nr:TPA: hypothetical protein N0F65_006458 [Lagenidium giganteum]
MASEPAHSMLELFAQAITAQDPTRSAAEKQLQQLHQSGLSASFLAQLFQALFMVSATPQATGSLAEQGVANGAVVATISTDIRLMACLWLKNYFKRHWKQQESSDEERQQIRQALLFAAVHEPHATVALHLELIIAQIARSDFPVQWAFEQLFVPVLQPLQEGKALTTEHRKRAVDVAYRVVKELSTRRLMVHRKQFASLSVNLLPLLLTQWDDAVTKTCALITSAQPTPDALEAAFGLVLTSTKLLSTIFLDAYRDLVVNHSDMVRMGFLKLYEHLEKLFQFRMEHAAALPEPLLGVVDKCCYRMAKIVVSLQKSYAIEFREYLTPFLTLFWAVLASTAVQTPACPTKLQIEALQFFSNVLSCRLYKEESLRGTSDTSYAPYTKVITATGDVALTDAMVLEGNAAVNAFINASESNQTRLNALLERTVMQFMRLSPQDLEDWESDAEEFVQLSESLTAQESVRACAENLFLTIMQSYPQQAIPMLKEMTSAASSWLQELVTTDGAADANKVLNTDAILLAIGLGCYDLHDCFDFEPWFLSNLVPVLMHPSAQTGSVGGLPVLRFRIVWLSGCWLAQLSETIRPPLYDALLNVAFFRDDGEAALKLRIVQTLESMVVDWGFQQEAFIPFLPRSLDCLCRFFSHTEQSESQMKVLSCIDAIIKACGADIIPFCEQVSAPLPGMWLSGGDANNLVRGKILQLLTNLLNSIKEDKARAAQHAPSIAKVIEMCLQVVRFATDQSNPDQVFLMEGGLEVWSSAMDVLDTYTEDLHVLFANALLLLQRDYEHVMLVSDLLERYLRMGKAQFWQTYHSGVGQTLESVIGNVKADAAIQLAKTLEVVVVLFPSDQIGSILTVAKQMVEACLAFKRNDPSRESELVIVAYMTVLARLLMHNPDLTLSQIFQNDQAALLTVVDLMLDKFYTVVSSSFPLLRRKVWVIALSSLLILPSEALLERTGQILDACVEVMDDEQEEKAEERPSDGAGAGAFRAYQSYKARSVVVSEEDEPVRSCDLKTFVSTKLNECAARLPSPAVLEQLMQTVDSSTLQKLRN